MHIEIEANHAEMSDFTWFHWEGQVRWSCIIIYASRFVATQTEDACQGSDFSSQHRRIPELVSLAWIESLNSYIWHELVKIPADLLVSMETDND
jgi:hypothetical protein